jgi:hypothetical protein
MSREIKLKIIDAGHKAVEELIKIAQEPILNSNEQGDELAPDKLKNAAATKKLAIFDAFEILNRIESERESIESNDKGISRIESKQGFAERNSR